MITATSISPLIESLKRIQLRDGLKDEDFADKLGVHRVSWNRIKNGRVEPGRDFLSGVRRAYPELKDAIDIFLSQDATNGSNSTSESPKI